MTAFITLAAKAYIDAAEQGTIPEFDLALENDQLVAATDELTVIRTSPDNRHHRAERGRIAVELFGFNDDNETMAADVIADILHWVSLSSGDDAMANAYVRALRYYIEEAR